MRQTVSLFFVAMCVAVPAMAQDFQQAPPAQPARVAMPMQAPQGTPVPAGPPRAATPTPQAGEPMPGVRRIDPGVDPADANIKLTLKIGDSGGSATTSKTVTMSVANMSSGRVRSSGTGSGRGQQQLSVDANAELRKSGLIHVSLTIYYSPEQGDETGARLENVNESISVFLKDGVPTVISTAADPTKGSRSVSVEVTASVVK